MKIQVIFSPHNVDELYFTGKTTVVIDVLRATSVITAAIKNGAREVIPVGTVDFAIKISGNAFGGQTLLGGERNTKKVEGFNLGNSPLEYTQDIVSGRSIILYTTNGTRAIVKAKFSENLVMCSFNNLASVAKYLNKLNKDVEILCAGSNGLFSIEDVVCAGKLITELKDLRDNLEVSDSAKASVVLDAKFGKNIERLLKNSEHGQLLIENDFKKDIEYCAKLSNINIVPVYNSGVIKKFEN